jgi:AmiR/NasT family two-component response regulator
MLSAAGGLGQPGTRHEPSAEQRRLFQEAKPMLQRLAALPIVQVAHHVIQTLDLYRDEEPDFVFALIAQCVRSVEAAGYAQDQIAATTVVAIVNAYLADHPEVFVAADRQRDLLQVLDAFVRAGWTEARALVFRISDIWR